MTDGAFEDSESMYEELSAYLDGELEGDAVRRVEERLAHDPAYQTALKRLEGAWRLLDKLPRATVGESFTKTTIEMVAVAADNDAAGASERRASRWWIPGLAGVLLTSLAGFAIGRYAWPDPNQELLVDLRVLENFPLFYQVDDVEFLRLLARENLFVDSEGDRGE